MVRVIKPGPTAARSSRDWCTVADAGGFNATFDVAPFAFICSAAGTVQIVGEHGNTMPIVVNAWEERPFGPKSIASVGTTLSTSQIWLLY